MEGAIFSVLAGLVASPVLAVPTSVGYGVGQGRPHGVERRARELRVRARGNEHRQRLRRRARGAANAGRGAIVRRSWREGRRRSFNDRRLSGDTTSGAARRQLEAVGYRSPAHGLRTTTNGIRSRFPPAPSPARPIRPRTRQPRPLVDRSDFPAPTVRPSRDNRPMARKEISSVFEKVAPRPASERASRERTDLAFALLLSLMIHALLLSLAFGGEGFGIAGLDFAWRIRRIEVPDLHVVIDPAHVRQAKPAVLSVPEPSQRASIEPPRDARPAAIPSTSPAHRARRGHRLPGPRPS